MIMALVDIVIVIVIVVVIIIVIISYHAEAKTGHCITELTFFLMFTEISFVFKVGEHVQLLLL